MSGVDKIKPNGLIAPLQQPRDDRSVRPGSAAKSGKTFDLQRKSEQEQPLISSQDKALQHESERDPSEDSWLRKRTIEELKTLVQAIQSGITDPWALTDLIFYARHPEMKGKPMTHEYQDLLDEWNNISAYLVHPTVNEIGDYLGANVLGGAMDGTGKADFTRAVEYASNFRINSVDGASNVRISSGSLKNYTTRFDEIIAGAVENCPGLSPVILKSLLAQESNFNTKVINSYGYAGIAQFGRVAAREVGLHVGVAGSASDERLDPAKAIPGAARLLAIKAQRLSEMAFSRYGQPNGIEFWKFVTAAYNGGEGTVALAMGHAYRAGLETARGRGMVGAEAVSFARRYASVWENLKIGGMNSPLGLAAARYFPTIAAQKYAEIGNYPTMIVARSQGRAA